MLSAGFQATLYVGMANIITKFYTISFFAVSFTLVVISLVELLSSYFLDFIAARIGFKSAMIISAMLNALGACVKCISVNINFFSILLIGQIFVAASLQFNYVLIPLLGKTWFKRNELITMQGIVISCFPAGSLIAVQESGIFATLNQSLFNVFNDAPRITIIAGVLLCLGGILGSIISGFILKKFHKYRITLAIIILLLTLFYVLFTIGLRLKIVSLIFISSFFIGATSLAALNIVLVFVVEVTYPIKEAKSTGVAMGAQNLMVFIIVPIVSYLISTYGAVNGNILFPAFGAIAFFSVLFVKENLRRRQANLAVEITETLSLLERNEDDFDELIYCLQNYSKFRLIGQRI
ncbi:feline leukemia virus subgroup C receptor-related protein 2-like isoform X1 [Dinothrombium tinctorium]|uniref:Feline leukemia virus subgroup C receptor-related protein 2-like isoform X1 n=1 Tax=Dinothrombium tinctorium TaxID=1965070 RepID=A0A3S3RWC1_9ACAR|nr:feline leukemia virus subgroup C receptor-related protein 2-like isoform X1 [Dinothrombium tinctorium]RWS06979.1 feline leukemia virus subgroup C receptor-related protein 2-like isoform X1 [Dinothrombium tinctorium]